MVKFTHLFVISILILSLAGSGCVGNETNVEEAGLNETPGANGSGNASAEQKLTEADVQEFEKNATDLENLLDNSSEEILVEEL
jgi:hypothetical protein